VWARLRSEQSIDPPSAGQPDWNVLGRKALVDEDDVFGTNHLALLGGASCVSAHKRPDQVLNDNRDVVNWLHISPTVSPHPSSTSRLADGMDCLANNLVARYRSRS
jgi:hypothetical protein